MFGKKTRAAALLGLGALMFAGCGTGTTTTADSTPVAQPSATTATTQATSTVAPEVDATPVMDTVTEPTVVQKLLGSTGYLHTIALSPDGKTLAAGGTDMIIRLWNLADGKELKTLEGHTGSVEGLAFSPDGKMLVSGGDDNTTRVWDVAEGKEVKKLEECADRVADVAFAPDGKSFATACWDDGGRVYDAAEYSPTMTYAVQGGASSVAYSTDGKNLAVGGTSQRFVMIDAASGDELWRTGEGSTSVLALAFSPDGKTLAAGMGDETARLIDAATGKELHKLEGHKNYVNTVAFTPDGKLLTTGSTDGTIRFWNTTDGAEQTDSKLSTYKSIEDLLYTDNGKTLITNATEEVWVYQMP